MTIGPIMKREASQSLLIQNAENGRLFMPHAMIMTAPLCNLHRAFLLSGMIYLLWYSNL